MEVVDINKDNITVRWQPPISDGGADLTEYVVEMKSPKDSQFAVVAQVQPNTPFYTARDLRQGKKYEFRVRAKNVVGVSNDAAELEAPVLAKAKPSVGRFYLCCFW